jgi:hypothetical protein
MSDAMPFRPSPIGGHDHLESLERPECLLRLQAHGVGRIGITIHGRPAIFPVNYVVHEDTIVLRTRGGGELATATDQVVVALEIDGFDTTYHEGWNVLVVGLATHVSDPIELSGLKGIRLSPWAGEDRDCLVRIALDEVTGRRLHHRAI